MKYLSRTVFLFLLLSLSYCLQNDVDAQVLSFESKLEIPLNDGTNIILFKEASSNRYYYLPPASSIRLAQKADETPEFLFLKFTTEQRADQGGAQGAIFHCLLEWGLRPDQMSELESKLQDKISANATVAGPVDLKAAEGESFRIVSAVMQDKQMTTSFVTSGIAPPMPGMKAAVAAQLDKNGAQLIDATFQKSRSISDVSIVLDYEYTVQVTGAKGKIEFKLDINHTQGDGIAYDLIKKELDKQPKLYDQALQDYEKNKKLLTDECGVGDGMTNVLIGLQAIDNIAGNTTDKRDTGSPWEYGVSEHMMRKLYDHFQSEEYINMVWEEELDDERITVIRRVFG